MIVQPEDRLRGPRHSSHRLDERDVPQLTRATPSSPSLVTEGAPRIIITFTGSVTLAQICLMSASSVSPGMKNPDAPASA